MLERHNVQLVEVADGDFIIWTNIDLFCMNEGENYRGLLSISSSSDGGSNVRYSVHGTSFTAITVL